MKRNHLLLIACITIFFASCSIEKRVYQSGYYISGRHTSIDDLDATKRVKPVVVEDVQTLETTSEEVIVAAEEYTSSAKPLVSSDSTIEESITTNIYRTNKIQIETNADSIPDEGKILLAKYEKNYAAKKKLKKIGFYPFVVSTFGFFTTFFILIPWLYGSLNNDSVFFTFLFIFLFGLVFLIPITIAYIILSIITKKQRRKLRRMGLIK
jgi:hypothetical protein